MALSDYLCCSSSEFYILRGMKFANVMACENGLYHIFLSTERTEIVVAPEDIVLVYGKKVIMRCEAKSDDSTPVLIRWLKDDVEIHYIEHHISVNSTDHSLHIRTEEDNDQGVSYKGKYTCIATNMYSEVQASAEIVLPAGPVCKY